MFKFLLSAIALAVANAEQPMTPYNLADVFSKPNLTFTDKCHDTHGSSHDDCKADTDNDCVWCVCGALPSSCFERKNAKKLPSSVFKCEFDGNAKAIGQVTEEAKQEIHI